MSASAQPEGGRATGDWQALAVFAGGADRLDAALERAVRPVIRSALDDGRLAEWYFTRWVDQRGPQLRIAVAGGGIDQLGAEILQGLGPALSDDAGPREPLMPPPASQRRGGRHVGVEGVEHRPEGRRVGGERAEELFQVSSEVVLETLPTLARGRERVAFGLSLMAVLSEQGLSDGDQPGFWDDVAVRWTGGDENGRRVLDRLAVYAQRLGPDLVRAAGRLREEGHSATSLERYAEGCRRMLACAGETQPSELVRQHTHLTSNRLGVNPLEEALLASILAVGPAGPASASDALTAERDGAPAEGVPGEPAGEAVRFEEVSKDNDGERVLDDVSLIIAEGESFGLVGPQGAGKSSALGVASGLRVVTAGTVRVLGADPVHDRQALVGDIGVALPDYELVGTRSVRDNLELRARPDGETADHVLETLGLRDRSAIAVENLGPSERRRVALGCALMSGPRIVFLDEPTWDLSVVEREEVWQVLRRLGEAGTTVILATTSVQEMRSVCDRAALVLAGEVIDVGDPDELAGHHFSPRSIHFLTVDEPDVALLQDLPEVMGVEVDQRSDHFALEVTTLQPDELLRLIGNDPDFPDIASVTVEDLEATFLAHAQGLPDDKG
jgi:ABC-2 type transport system ATP-binding protein